MIDGDQHNELTRASHGAGSATGALVIVDLAYSILIQTDGIEHTGIHAVVLRHAAEVALVGSTGDIDGSFAGAHSLVGIAPLGVFVATGAAMNHSHFAHTGAGFHAHDLGNGKDGVTATRGTLVDQLAVMDDSIGIAGTTGHPTGTAIGSRKSCSDLFHSGVDLHMKDLGGKGENQAKDGSQSAHNQDGKRESGGQAGF